MKTPTIIVTGLLASSSAAIPLMNSSPRSPESTSQGLEPRILPMASILSHTPDAVKEQYSREGKGSKPQARDLERRILPMASITSHMQDAVKAEYTRPGKGPKPETPNLERRILPMSSILSHMPGAVREQYSREGKGPTTQKGNDGASETPPTGTTHPSTRSIDVETAGLRRRGNRDNTGQAVQSAVSRNCDSIPECKKDPKDFITEAVKTSQDAKDPIAETKQFLEKGKAEPGIVDSIVKALSSAMIGVM
ncbi:hypothetical protein AA313_de0207658 [Arthrobotrys entomopaga]|nr:hypothetical protein AA313_de0207658 [Arthrobotrys entomopaga]